MTGVLVAVLVLQQVAVTAVVLWVVRRLRNLRRDVDDAIKIEAIIRRANRRHLRAVK